MKEIFLEKYKNADEFTQMFFKQALKMMSNSKMNEDTLITPDNIYQQAHMENRDLLFEVVKKSHLEGSTILGSNNLLKLYDLAQKGKSCMILSEHVSNLDVPSMFVRYYDYPDNKLKEIFEKIIFVAGVKLNENPLVKLYTEMFTRIVIFPIRSLDKIVLDQSQKDKVDMAKKINIRSARKIKELRNQGNIFVMFPAGTRYRPWDPDTKKGIKEAASYLKSFDYFCTASINGNNMPPIEHEDMTQEPYLKDVFVLNYSEVQNTKEYIEKIVTSDKVKDIKDQEIVKQIIVDTIMNDIDKLHLNADVYRKQYLK